MSLKVTFSQEFKNIVEKRAKELISSGEKEGLIDDSFYGPLQIFVDNKPASVLFSAEVDGHQIHVGGDQE